MQDDIFEATFALLKQSLSFSAKEPTTNAEELLRRKAADCAVESAQMELSHILAMKQLVAERFSHITGVYESAVGEISAAKSSFEGKAKVHHGAVTLRAQSQQTVAERRLQELVLEMIGEYGKSLLRGKRREESLIASNRRQVVELVWKLQWQRFAARLHHDMANNIPGLEVGVTMEPLSPSTDRNELRKVVRRVCKKIGLFSDSAFWPEGVLRVSRSSIKSNPQPQSSPIFYFAQSPEDLAQALSSASQALAALQPSIRTSTKSPTRARSAALAYRPRKYSMKELITNECIDYIHGPSLCPHQWALAQPILYPTAPLVPNLESTSVSGPSVSFLRMYETIHGSALLDRRVYVCLEERALRCMVNPGGSASDDSSDTLELYATLQAIYTNYHLQADVITKELHSKVCTQLRSNLLRVQSFHTLHQVFSPSRDQMLPSSQMQMLRAFPEVVAADCNGQILHFAPVAVPLLREALDGLTLCVLAWSPGASRQNAILRPQSSSAPSLSTKIQESICPSAPGAPLAGASTAVAGSARAPTPPSTVVFALPLHLVAVQALAAHYNVEGDDNSHSRAPSGWSCLSVLPDHAALRPPLMQAPRYQHAYVLIDMGPAVYLVQLLPVSSAGPAAADRDMLMIQSQLSDVLRELWRGEVVKADRDAGAPPEEAPGEQEREWDVAVLSNFCHWRSCTTSVASSSSSSSICFPAGTSAASTGAAVTATEQAASALPAPSSSSTSSTTSASTMLCAHHRALQQFLDRRLSPTESSKYLPKRPPALQGVESGKRDLLLIRAASTLLQELWDGRLRQTLKLFNRKVSSDLKTKSFLETKGTRAVQKWLEEVAQSSGQPVPPPTWIVWKDSALHRRMIERQDDSLALLQSIIDCEKQTRAEIAQLLSLQVFPAQEIAIIRKDLRSLRERQEASLSQEASPAPSSRSGALALDLLSDNYDQLIALLRDELLLCEKKLKLLRERRAAEEEQQAQLARRQARLRAMEEAQAKDRDPASFRNQQGRF